MVGSNSSPLASHREERITKHCSICSSRKVITPYYYDDAPKNTDGALRYRHPCPQTCKRSPAYNPPLLQHNADIDINMVHHLKINIGSRTYNQRRANSQITAGISITRFNASAVCAGTRIHHRSSCEGGVELSRFPPRSSLCSLPSMFRIVLPCDSTSWMLPYLLI
ncbi:hypothetical protein BJY01DRAFT_210430 [Aspergillus pseudoustus]|uniref:Uncharacterized protein n=1 Tax=Aspergillus pseudoustus TaxID=1810923 RepID=A0ABR4KC57_9EURO